MSDLLARLDRMAETGLWQNHRETSKEAAAHIRALEAAPAELRHIRDEMKEAALELENRLPVVAPSIRRDLRDMTEEDIENLVRRIEDWSERLKNASS